MKKYLYYTDGFWLQTRENYSFQLPPELKAVHYTGDFVSVDGGYCNIRRGYASDGPSGPTFKTKNFIRGAVEHDALYQLIRLGIIPPEFRDICDRHLVKTLKEDGMWWPRRTWTYLGLKYFGAKAAMSDNIRQKKRAPR